jgi:hypothetical protein
MNCAIKDLSLKYQLKDDYTADTTDGDRVYTNVVNADYYQRDGRHRGNNQQLQPRRFMLQQGFCSVMIFIQDCFVRGHQQG